MMNFRSFLENSLDDLFPNIKQSPVIKQEERVIPYTLTLYRGFNADLKDLEQDSQHYYLSPKRSEQGLLWFTHKFINGHDPLEYARNHGEWLLTYPLTVKKHIQVNTRENGEEYNSIPDYFSKFTQPTENSRFYAGIELPEGWLFSYKYEKFIGCNHKLKVLKTHISQA